MKTKKIKLDFSMENLALNKESVMNLSENAMENVVGGVTAPPHSVSGQCLSFDTNCYTQCVECPYTDACQSSDFC
jgi:hypothetical protein